MEIIDAGNKELGIEWLRYRFEARGTVNWVEFDPGPYKGNDGVAFRIPGLEGGFCIPFSEL